MTLVFGFGFMRKQEYDVKRIYELQYKLDIYAQDMYLTPGVGGDI